MLTSEEWERVFQAYGVACMETFRKKKNEQFCSLKKMERTLLENVVLRRRGKRGIRNGLAEYGEAIKGFKWSRRCKGIKI